MGCNLSLRILSLNLILVAFSLHLVFCFVLWSYSLLTKSKINARKASLKKTHKKDGRTFSKYLLKTNNI